MSRQVNLDCVGKIMEEQAKVAFMTNQWQWKNPSKLA